MRKSTVPEDSVKKMISVKRKGSIEINPRKLQQFCQLWSMNTPKEIIQKKLAIKQAQYYRYITASEEIVNDFLLGLVDHGLVMQFKTSLEDVQQRRIKLNDLVKESLDRFNEMDLVEKNITLKLINTANSTEKLYSELLDDTKIINQTTKVLNKVIVDNAMNRVQNSRLSKNN